VAAVVDAVAIMSMDGRTHAALLSKIAPACPSVFVNKPLATSQREAASIADTARRHRARWFSASALRFAVDPPAPVRRAVVECPLWFEPANAGWFWYGMHGIELLLKLMGPGIVAARVESFPEHERLQLGWRDGRQGVVVGHYARDAAFTYACDDGPAVPVDPGVDRLEEAMLRFFAGGNAPVTPAETLEVIAAVEAANLSRANGGRRIVLEPIS
jgi:predicted dehydrogenase